ncbi:MAG: SPOR domain-containing protein [Chromatiaceae bacterium]
MEEGAKRRLVGTAVVVLLLVIFVPMLLDEKPPESLPDEDMMLPERPKAEPGGGGPPAMMPAQEAPNVAPAPQELPVPPLAEPPESESTAPPSEPKAVPAAPYQPERPSVAEKRTPAPAVVKKEEGGSAAPRAGGVSSWVIQVASLSEPQRAKTLERDLRGKGFPAFIEEARVDRKTFHRVRVGPEADRKRIEAMAAAIEAKTGLSVQIQHYP